MMEDYIKYCEENELDPTDGANLRTFKETRNNLTFMDVIMDSENNEKFRCVVLIGIMDKGVRTILRGVTGPEEILDVSASLVQNVLENYKKD